MSSALYIHIPFCEKRCGYCDFYTVADRQDHIPAYVRALKQEMAQYAGRNEIRDLTFSTLFFGGGTPSLLQIDQLADLLDTAYQLFHFSTDPEVTLETNPGTVDLAKLKALRQSGINRLSIGVQSFHEQELHFLDRIHSAEQAEACVRDARQAGFDNISLDIIFGIPGQTLETWQHNLERCVTMQPEHISAYSLTYESGTPLTSKLTTGAFKAAKETLQRDMHLRTIDYLAKQGFEQYEISNYCRPGFESKHNRKYWDGSFYLGLGTSAHSYIAGKRFWNISNYSAFITKLDQGTSVVSEEEILNNENISTESIWLGLRQRQGLNLQRYAEVTGEAFLPKHIAKLQKFFPQPIPPQQFHALTTGNSSLSGSLLNIRDGHLKLTDEGVVLCDSICAEIV